MEAVSGVGSKARERLRVTATREGDERQTTRLVSAACQGDREAFGLLYDRFARMVHGILLARVPRGEVDDLMHDVFLTALERLSALRDPSSFGSWLAAITRNRATDYHRRFRETVELPDHLSAEDSPRAEALEALDIIRSLPVAYRETLLLRLVEGLTGPEISELTGLTPASVRVNLHRGMKLLRQKLGRTDHELGRTDHE